MSGHREKFADIRFALFRAFLRFLHLGQIFPVFRILHDFFQQSGEGKLRLRIQEIKNHRGKGLEFLSRRCRERDGFARHERFEKRNPLLFRVIRQFLHRRIPDAAPRDIHDAPETDVVAEIRQEAQIGHDIFDFLAPEERHVADQRIREPFEIHRFFQRTRLRVHAIQNGDIGQRTPFFA